MVTRFSSIGQVYVPYYHQQYCKPAQFVYIIKPCHLLFLFMIETTSLRSSFVEQTARNKANKMVVINVVTTIRIKEGAHQVTTRLPPMNIATVITTQGTITADVNWEMLIPHNFFA